MGIHMQKDEFRSLLYITFKNLAQTVKSLPAMQETQVWPVSQENPLEKRMTTLSSILAWRIPWTERPGGLRPWNHKEWDTTEWLTLSLHFIFKIHSKWTKDLNVRAYMIKLLEENISINLCDVGLGNDFLNITPKAQEIKEKVDTLNLIKI